MSFIFFKLISTFLKDGLKTEKMVFGFMPESRYIVIFRAIAKPGTYETLADAKYYESAPVELTFWTGSCLRVTGHDYNKCGRLLKSKVFVFHIFNLSSGCSTELHE